MKTGLAKSKARFAFTIKAAANCQLEISVGPSLNSLPLT